MADQLAAATRFPQDAFISLDEETHVYTVYGQQIQLSVTGVVESVYPVFDDEQVLASMRARGSIQRSSVYQGMTNAEISRKWRANAADAARKGSEMHRLIYEALISGVWPDTDHHGVTYAHELEMARLFVQEMLVARGCELIRAEMRIFYKTPADMPVGSPFVLPGSLDGLFRTSDERYGIFDWKRTPEIKFDNPYATSDIPAFGAFAADTNFNRYSLQLCIYACILQDQYGLNIDPDELYIVALHPALPTYQCIRAVNMMHVVRSELFANFDACRIRAAERAAIREKNRLLYE